MNHCFRQHFQQQQQQQQLHHQRQLRRRDWVRKLGQAGCSDGSSMLSLEFGLAGARAFQRPPTGRHRGDAGDSNWMSGAAAGSSLPRIGGAISAGLRSQPSTASYQQRQHLASPRCLLTSPRREPSPQKSPRDQQQASSCTPPPPLLYISGSRQAPSATRRPWQRATQHNHQQQVQPARSALSAVAIARRRPGRSAVSAAANFGSGLSRRTVGPWPAADISAEDETVTMLRHLLESATTCPLAEADTRADDGARQQAGEATTAEVARLR